MLLRGRNFNTKGWQETLLGESPGEAAAHAFESLKKRVCNGLLRKIPSNITSSPVTTLLFNLRKILPEKHQKRSVKIKHLLQYANEYFFTKLAFSSWFHMFRILVKLWWCRISQTNGTKLKQRFVKIFGLRHFRALGASMRKILRVKDTFTRPFAIV